MKMWFSCVVKYSLECVGLWRKVLMGGKLYSLGSRYMACHGGRYRDALLGIYV